jgi:hypothetical protein
MVWGIRCRRIKDRIYSGYGGYVTVGKLKTLFILIFVNFLQYVPSPFQNAIFCY